MLVVSKTFSENMQTAYFNWLEPRWTIVSLRKTLNAIIPTSGDATQWISELATVRLSILGMLTELRNASLCPWERHLTPIIPYRDQTFSCFVTTIKVLLNYVHSMHMHLFISINQSVHILLVSVFHRQRRKPNSPH